MMRLAQIIFASLVGVVTALVIGIIAGLATLPLGLRDLALPLAILLMVVFACIQESRMIEGKWYGGLVVLIPILGAYFLGRYIIFWVGKRTGQDKIPQVDKFVNRHDHQKYALKDVQGPGGIKMDTVRKGQFTYVVATERVVLPAVGDAILSVVTKLPKLDLADPEVIFLFKPDVDMDEPHKMVVQVIQTYPREQWAEIRAKINPDINLQQDTLESLRAKIVEGGE